MDKKDEVYGKRTPRYTEKIVGLRPTIRVNMNLAIHYFVRPFDKAYYYGPKRIVRLKPGEMDSISKILRILHKQYIENLDNKREQSLNIKSIHEKTLLQRETVSRIVFKLILFLDINTTAARVLMQSRFSRLNKYGLLLHEILNEVPSDGRTTDT